MQADLPATLAAASHRQNAMEAFGMPTTEPITEACYVLLLGAPGAGKGTQAKIITNLLGIAHISSGDLFRDNIKRGTELGLLAKSFMDRGELVPDKVTIDMIFEVLRHPDYAKGALLDGFPRTASQAKALDVALKENFNTSVNVVIYIKVADNELLNRLSGRWTCPVDGAIYNVNSSPPRVLGICDNDGAQLIQRPDDTREKAVHRLQVFYRETAPIIEYYRRTNKLAEIDGQRSVADVTLEIEQVLGLSNAQ